MTDLSKKADELAQNTVHSIGTVQVAKDAIQSAYEKVEVMNQMSENIKATISIVEDISDRVNLLSLNASIEAARAGSMGRGFAVVAGEVSRLADETAKNNRGYQTSGEVISSGIQRKFRIYERNHFYK